MSETTKTPKIAKDLESINIRLAKNFLARQVEIDNLQIELEKLRKRQKADLAKNPFLGNMIGVIRKASTTDEVAEARKKKRKAEDSEMEDVEKKKVSSSTPKERLQKLLNEKKPEQISAEKAKQTERLREESAFKF